MIYTIKETLLRPLKVQTTHLSKKKKVQTTLFLPLCYLHFFYIRKIKKVYTNTTLGKKLYPYTHIIVFCYPRSQRKYSEK
jgi:hypothetical protein